MIRLISWLKSLLGGCKWVIWGVLGVCGTVLVLILRGLLTGTKKVADTASVTPSSLQKKADQAEIASVAVRTAANDQAGQVTAGLAEISDITDDKERRQKLADLLKNLN